MISPERMEALQTQWARLASGYAVELVTAYPILDQLVAAYTEPHRHYHTLEHLTEMFKVAGRLMGEVQDPSLLMLAIWFHDAVYDVHSHDNEERSADLAVELLKPYSLATSQQEQLRRWIRATQHTGEPPHDVETAVLLDADLAILAAGEARYTRYAQAIRQEYAHIPEADYRRGRHTVLTRFRDRPKIYQTERMAMEAEPAARQNIHAEMASLEDAGLGRK